MRTLKHNAKAYIKGLTELNNWINQQVKQVPQSQRTIVSSENTLKYFGRDYGFQSKGIWELNSHEEGTPQQISELVELVKKKNITALFAETTVDKSILRQ